MKIYHMIVGRRAAENVGDHSTRKEYMSVHQGSAPAGWVCVGVCGYHETPKRNQSDLITNTETGREEE